MLGLGKKVGSFEPRKFVIGDHPPGLPPAVEDNLTGLKKKGTRFLAIPPSVQVCPLKLGVGVDDF